MSGTLKQGKGQQFWKSLESNQFDPEASFTAIFGYAAPTRDLELPEELSSIPQEFSEHPLIRGGDGAAPKSTDMAAAEKAPIGFATSITSLPKYRIDNTPSGPKLVIETA